jgi:hypothetical protein
MTSSTTLKGCAESSGAGTATFNGSDGMPITKARCFAAALTVAFWCALALVLARLFQRGKGVFDIILWDETSYLYQGLTLSPQSFTSYETSPGYSVFYFLLSKVISDPVDLYLIGGITIVCAAFVAVIAGTLAASGSKLFALAAGAFLIATGYLFTWPRAGLAAVAWICVTFVIASRLTTAYSKLSLFTVSCYLLMLIRPEFSLSFFILLVPTAAAAFLTLCHRERLCSKANVAGHAALAALLCLVWFAGFPSISGGGRAFVAFGQHVAYRFVTSTGSALDPWTNWEAIVADIFPNAQGFLAGAFAASPGAFLNHMRENSADIVPILRGAISDGTRHYLGIRSGEWMPLIALAMFLSVLALGGARAIRQSRNLPINVRDAALDLLLLGALSVPVLISVIVIYPRHHYLLILVVLAFLVIGRLLHSSNAASLGSNVGVVLAALALVVLVRPLPVGPTAMKDLILRLRQSEMRAVFEVEGNICAYMIPPCRAVFPWSWPSYPNQPISEHLEKLGVDAILVSPRLLGFAPLAADREWNELLRDPSQFGFGATRLTDSVTLLRRTAP